MSKIFLFTFCCLLLFTKLAYISIGDPTFDKIGFFFQNSVNNGQRNCGTVLTETYKFVEHWSMSITTHRHILLLSSSMPV